MKSIFTTNEIEFILINYPNRGSEYCADILHKPLSQIQNKVIKLRTSHKLRLSPELYKKRISLGRTAEKTYDQYAVNPDKFLNVNTSEVAYLLGLIWADGWVYCNGYQNNISLEMVTDDIKHLRRIFLMTGTWTESCRTRKNRRQQSRISTNNKIIAQFLLNNDYKSKSEMAATKILSKIPENLICYWFRGLVDGDGCFYINKKNKCYQFSIASSYDQDWSFVEELFIRFNICYSIQRRQQVQHGKIHKSSIIRITNKTDISKFGNYIYTNYPVDKIGLERKYKKYIKINDAL